jgi:hypothetical protein
MKTMMTAALAAATMTIAPAPATADTAINGWTGARFSNPGYDEVFTYGWTFTPTTALTLVSLGVYDDGRDGLIVAHDVGLWDSSGTLLTSTTIGAGTASGLIGDFRYNAVAGLTLAAGATYTIGTTHYALGGDRYQFAPSSVDADSRIGFIGGVRSDILYGTTSPGLIFPTLSPNTGRFGPNFLFDAAGGGAVPEPATWALMILGFGAIGGAMRRRRAAIRVRFAMV